ncbi:MAG: sulfotransferase [Myxococcales bacterium]|nr:sulfotransferase [Myxococcales bacterium]
MTVSLGVFNHYHVDPASTNASDPRHPRNFVRYAALLAPITWLDRASWRLRKRSAWQLGKRLVAAFDDVGLLHPRWGSEAELAVLRNNIQLFGNSIDQNPYISAIGRFLLGKVMLGHLANRAAFIRFYEENRDFIAEHGRYVAPVLVTGFPRTGTTLLQRLLSEDPNTRSPYTYELEKTTPPLRAHADPLRDARIEKSAATLATLQRLAPGFVEKFSESHVWSATEREESLTYIQLHNGLNVMNAAQAGRSYLHSMMKPEVADALFAYERNFFSMLDAFAPARSHWTNKAPTYAPYFGKIFEHYPDARVVITHRHPGKNIASVCRLLESWMLPFDEEGSFDKIRLGDILLDGLQVIFDAPMAYRIANPQRESQIVDCLYSDLFSDPIGMVRQIYAKFNIPYTAAFEQRMRVYLANNQQGKYGRHKYSNDEYGFDPDRLAERLRGYYSKFGYGTKPQAHD